MSWVAFLAGMLGLLGASACRRREPLDGTPLYAPFNQRKPIAVLVSKIEPDGYEVVARSLMSGRLALRLEGLRLQAEGEAVVPLDPAEVGCVLAGGERVRLLVGSVAGLDPGAGYAIAWDGETIPLDQPGRSMYREWAWLRRPAEVERIDAELAELDRLPLCRSITAGSVVVAQ